MNQEDYFILKVTPEDIGSLQFDSADQLMEAFTADSETIAAQPGSMIFDLEDISGDNREPGENPEIRQWFSLLDKRYPYLPYFLSRDEQNDQVALYASLIVPFSLEGDALRFDRQKLEKFALDKITAISDFCSEYSVDSRDNIRRFCERLHLDVIEEMVDSPNSFPFEPEKITSPFLLDFFDSGYYFHTIDASDEAVLFALVDDPTNAYYAATSLSIELFRSGYYPVIALEMVVYDIPENPLKMTFVYNVDVEKHRKELYSYSEMPYVTANFLYRENEELYYGFTKAVELPDDLRAEIRDHILEASNLLRAIPREARNFGRAVEQLFMAKERGESSKPNQQPVIASDIQDETNVPEKADALDDAQPTPQKKKTKKKSKAKEEGSKKAESLKFPFAEDPERDSIESSSDDEDGEPVIISETETEQENQQVESAPDILEEIEVADVSMDPDIQRDQPLHSPYESQIPISVLPESIQRITKALSKPLRRPSTSVTEQLAVTPAPKKIVTRDEDQLGRLSRRLLIIQNNVESAEREKMRLANELKTAREEIERLQRENLALENRWWKFWK